jgi:hypothetical protein
MDIFKRLGSISRLFETGGTFMKQVHVTVASILLLCSLFSQAQRRVAPAKNAERLLKFRGTLADVDGKPLSGAVGVTFLVYKDEQGGAPLWLETQDVQADATGHYTALLSFASADGMPLLSSAEVYWMSTQISGQPRHLLVPD